MCSRSGLTCGRASNIPPDNLETGQQRAPVLDQLGHRLVPFHAAGLIEKIEGEVGLGFGLGLPDVVQMAFCLGLDGFGRRPLVARTNGATRTTVQHIHGLVDPTALLPRRGEHLAPKAERTRHAPITPMRKVGGGTRWRTGGVTSGLEIRLALAP